MLPGRSLWNQIFVFGYKITLKRDSGEGKTNVGLSCWWLLSGKIYVTRSMTRQTDSDQISLLTHHNQHTVIRTQLTWSRINCVTVYLEISVNTASNNNNISNNKYVLTLNMKKHKLLYEKEKKNKHLLIVMTITAFLRCCLLMTPTVWIWTLLLKSCCLFQASCPLASGQVTLVRVRNWWYSVTRMSRYKSSELTLVGSVLQFVMMMVKRTGVSTACRPRPDIFFKTSKFE